MEAHVFDTVCSMGTMLRDTFQHLHTGVLGAFPHLLHNPSAAYGTVQHFRFHWK